MSHSPISSPSIHSPHGGHMMSPQHHHSSSPPHHSQSQPQSAESEVEEKKFISSLFSFMTNRGTPIEKIPIFDHKELNLHKLYTCVITRGGLEAVIENKLWRQITTDLAVDPERTDAGFRLRIHYLKFLYPYERKYFLKMDDDERFDYEAFEKHLSKSPSDKKGASSRKKKFQNAIMSPQPISTSPNSGKSTPSPTSSPNTLLVSALPTQSIPQIQPQNHYPSQQPSLHYSSQVESPSNNYTASATSNTASQQNNHHHYQTNSVNNNSTAPESLHSSMSSTSQFFTNAILNNTSSNIANPVAVNLKLLEDKSLRRYNGLYRLKVSNQPSRKELIKAVIQHFGQQKVDEESIINSFLRRMRADTNTRIRPVEKV